TQQKEMDEFLNDLGEEYEYLQENPNVYYDKALFAYNNGQYEEALTNAQKATELSPQWALPYNLQGLCLMYGNGDYEAAEAPLRKAVELVEAEQKPYFQFDLAQALYSNNDHEGAIELLNEVTQAQPDFAHAWNWLGINYRYTKEYDPGKAACQHALDLEPGNPQYQYEMGAMLYDSGDVEASIPYFQTCLLLESQENMYWHSNSKITLDWIQQNTQFPLLPEEEVRARISSEVNLEEESFYDDAGNLNVELLKEKAEKSFNEGDYQQAEELLYMLLDDGQSDPLTLFYLGMVFNGQYRLEEALDLFQFTLEMAEAEEEGYDILEPFFQFGLANAYFLMDDLDNAEAAALKSIDEANDFFEGYYLLSSIYDLQGDYERSQEMLDKYVEMGGVLEEFDDH
ncbi:MAG: tetratricopeptide repeat protein, partial [Saprospiraceae bacterium]|nr:tetratricopeptide repeat protein [Saprospiraceae bacterium]MCB0624807.1 tetratricopeptide repeat protein [Saprospiraceae bacterium]